MTQRAGQTGPQAFARWTSQPVLDPAVERAMQALAGLAQPVAQVAQHPAAHQPVARPHDVAEKINALGNRRQPARILEFQLQLALSKFGDGVPPEPELVRVRMQ